MLEFLYQVLILPFELGLGAVYELILSQLESVGWSIVLLSLLVNTILLPLFRLADKWQRAELARQSCMAEKLAEIKQTYKGYERHALINTLYRQHQYNPFASLKSVLGLLIQIPFFLAAYGLLLDHPSLREQSFLVIDDLAKPDGLIVTWWGNLNLLPFLMLSVNLVAVAAFSKRGAAAQNLQQYGLALVFFVALYMASSGLLVYWTVSNIFNLVKIVLAKKSTVAAVSNSLLDAQGQQQGLHRYAGRLYLMGVSLALFLPLISAPLALLASGNSADFSEPLGLFISPLLGYLVGAGFLAFLVFLVVPESLRLALGVATSFVALSLLINMFVFSADYGDMSNFVFDHGLEIARRFHILNVVALALLFACFVLLLVMRKAAVLLKTLQAAVLTVLLMAIFDAYAYTSKRAGLESSADPHQQNVFKFSRTGQNVLVVMMDRLMGGFIPNALDTVRNSRNELDGFVWYPKTLSPGAFTLNGVPSIAGGYDYLPAVINNLADKVPLRTRLHQSFSVLPYNFDLAGFTTAIVQPSAFFIAKDRQHLGNTRLTWLTDHYHEQWRQRNGVASNDASSSLHSKLIHFGLFRVAPTMFRRKIYANGTWTPFKQNVDYHVVRTRLEKQGLWKRSTYYGGINSSKNTAAIGQWSVIDDLSLLSTVVDEPQGSFHYFTNEINHEPWITRADLNIEVDAPVTFTQQFVDKFKSKETAQHAITAAATIKHVIEWTDWMKQNDVYDNTRIIIVSDHGRNLYNPMFVKQRLTTEGEIGEYLAQVGFFHSTLMVKDFASREPLRQSDKLMTTADVPWLALQGIRNGVNPHTGKPIKEPINKTPWSAAYTPWRLQEHRASKFNVHEHFIVENDNIFDLESWRIAPQGSELPMPQFEFDSDE